MERADVIGFGHGLGRIKGVTGPIFFLALAIIFVNVTPWQCSVCPVWAGLATDCAGARLKRLIVDVAHILCFVHSLDCRIKSLSRGIPFAIDTKNSAKSACHSIEADSGDAVICADKISYNATPGLAKMRSRYSMSSCLMSSTGATQCA